MNNIDNIICEVINESTSKKEVINESVLSDIKNLLKKYTSKKNKSSEDERNERKLKKKLNKAKKGRRRLRRTKQGGKTYYDYDDYEKRNKKLAKGDVESVVDTVDQEKTDIAAVARDVFPKHTEEGAQSQLRKILNKERPMTKQVAAKLNKMISSGQVAVK
jgi:hypothetical protein